MIAFYKTTASFHIISALERYVEYSLNISFIKSSDIDSLHYAEIIFVIDNDIDLTAFCNSIYNIRKASNTIRFIGFDQHYDINLTDLNSIENQFYACLDPTKRAIFSDIPFFSKRLTTFFKGHGEESLLGCIGWVNYYIQNYSNLSKIGDFTSEELYDNYLLQGITHWNEFTCRFIKYVPIIYTAGWNEETLRIEQLINIVSAELKEARKSDSFIKFENDSLIAISEISNIIEEIQKQIIIKNGETSYPYSR